MITDVGQDVRYAARMLVKNPAFTAIAIMTLALGIGANTAMFSVVNAVLLRPLPFVQPDRLMQVRPSRPDILTAPEFMDLASQSRSFEQVGAYANATFNLAGGVQPERINAARISAGLLPTLGVQPLYGRNIPVEGDREGGEQVLLLAHGLWQRQFGADPAVVGKTVRLDERSYVVIGVLPPGLQFPDDKELFVPLGLTAFDLNNRDGFFLRMIVRLKEGVSRAQANAEISTIVRTESKGPRSGGVSLLPLHEALAGDVRRMMLVLMGAVVFVMLIACTNLANLQLTAATRRQSELSIRLSLGASRGRVIRQLLTESVLLSFLGGLAGLLLAYWGTSFVNAGLPGTIPRTGSIEVDRQVLGFTLVLTVIVGLVFGTLPALRASRNSLSDTMRTGRTQGLAHAGSRRLRAFLVVSQLALTVVLLFGAGLLIRSFLKLEQTPLGFVPERLMTARITLAGAEYATPATRLNFSGRLLDQVRRESGLNEAALTSFLPFASGNQSFGLMMDGIEEIRRGTSANFRSVTANYFGVMGIPLLKGREFSEADRQGSPMVAVINDTMARAYWPNANPLGKRIKETSNEAVWREVVGIVGSVRHRERGEEPRPEMFVPWNQAPARTLNLAVRTALRPQAFSSSFYEAVKAVDPNIPVFEVRTMEDRLFQSVAQPRFRTVLLVIFALLALMTATIGLYAVMAFSVSQRTHEIGVRIAVGAQQRDVISLVLSQGARLVVIGIAIGLVLATLLARVMTTLLFAIKPLDPVTLVGVPFLLSCVALLACWLPARRASRVDPLTALRYE